MAYTSLHLYRPSRPPQVTTQGVARFLKAFGDRSVSEEAGGLFSIGIKCGDDINHDALSTHHVEKIDDYIGMIREIEWDIESNNLSSIKEVIDQLNRSREKIYRCHVTLGHAVKSLSDYFHPADGDEPLILDMWSFSVQPITSYEYEANEEYVLGWIGLTLSGYGSLYPWKPKDIVERAEGHPELEKLRDLCRATWPVAGKPDSRVQHLREQMGDLWPYDRLDKPLDWFWGVG